MRVAYLITAYGEWAHLERLVGALDGPGVGFFVHVDARSEMPAGLLAGRENVVFTPRRKVWWGGWSHVEAILELMAAAVEGPGGSDSSGGSGGSGDVGGSAGPGDYDYCVVLSGADYPIRSNRVIFETLAGGGEFINAEPGFRPDKPESRVSVYRFDGFDRRRGNSLKTIAMRAAEALLKTLGVRKRRYPFEQIFSGVVWSALSAPCVRYILDYAREHPRFTNFFRTAQVPEEMFFATIVGNSPFAKNIRGTITFMDWDHSQAGPPLITADHLPRLAPGVKIPHHHSGRSYERMFARKFDHTSGQILDYIDANWRNQMT